MRTHRHPFHRPAIGARLFWLGQSLFWLGALLIVMAGCATSGPPTSRQVLAGLYASLGAIDEQVGKAAFAGTLSSAKATQLLDRSADLRKDLGAARALLDGCRPDAPCEAFDTSLRGINERLLELQCRKRAAEAKLPEDDCKLPPRAAQGAKA